MITVRTGAYSKEDVGFLAEVLRTGLQKNCFNFPYEKTSEVCAECRHKIACNEAESALHHVLAVMCSKQAKTLSEKNKSL